MIGCKWCSNAVAAVVFAGVIAGPTLNSGGGETISVPRKRSSSATEMLEIGFSLNGARAGTVAIKTKTLDLSSLSAADFGDAEPAASN